MLDPTWLTDSLRVVLAGAALAAAASSTALGQASAATQEPSPPTVAPADADTSGDRRRETPDTPFRRLSLFDRQQRDRAKPDVAAESWLSGLDLTCVGCRETESTTRAVDSTNGFAPWAVQGRWQRRTMIGVVSAGFVGVRNYGLPLAGTLPIDGVLDPAVLQMSGASAFLPRAQWSVTAGIERTLVRRASGASVGVKADVLIPVKDETAVDTDPRTRTLKSSTVRVGGILRW